MATVPASFDPAALGSTDHDVDMILKEIYGTQFPETFNNETVLLSRLQKKQMTLTGEQFVFPIHTRRNLGVGPRPETGVNGAGVGSTTLHYLPTPGAQQAKQGTLKRRHYYGRFHVTGPALSAARGSGAMVDLLALEMSGLRRDLAKEINRDLFSDGSGALGSVTSGGSAAGTVLTLEPNTVMGNFEVGQYYTICAVAGQSAITDYLTAVDASAKTITTSTDQNAAVDDTDVVVRHGEGDTAGDASAYDASLAGLDLIVNDGATGSTHIGSDTYAGLDRNDSAVAAYWDAQVLNGAGGMSIDLLLQGQQEMRKGNGSLSLVLLSPYNWRKYGELMDANRRWVGQIQKLDGGFQSLDFNGVPVVADLDCPDDVIYMLDESTFTILEEEPPNFINRMGSPFVFVGTGGTATDVFEVTMVWRLNLCCNNPGANCRIKSLPL